MFGGATRTIQLTLDASGLSPDTYSAQVSVVSTAPDDSRIDVPVTLVVADAAPEIEAVGESVKRALTKSKIKSKFCAIAVAGSSVITKKITMPANLSEDEMEGQVQLEADQYIPYPLEEVNLDFQVLGETEGNPETVDVLLAACRRETIEARVEAIEVVVVNEIARRGIPGLSLAIGHPY